MIVPSARSLRLFSATALFAALVSSGDGAAQAPAGKTADAGTCAEYGPDILPPLPSPQSCPYAPASAASKERSIFSVPLGSSPQQVMNQLNTFLNGRLCDDTTRKVQGICTWPADDGRDRKLEKAPNFYLPGKNDDPFLIEYTPCTAVRADIARKNWAEAAGIPHDIDTTFGAGDVCIQSILYRENLRNSWATYAKFFFREEYDPAQYPDTSPCTDKPEVDENGRVAPRSCLHKIEWKGAWLHYDEWLQLTRPDLISEFVGAYGKWIDRDLRNYGPVIRYRWDKEPKLISDWDEIQRAHCGCPPQGICSCVPSSKNSHEQFLTLDVSYQPRAVLTLSRGPVFEETWERLRDRYVVREVEKFKAQKIYNLEAPPEAPSGALYPPILMPRSEQKPAGKP